MKTFNRTLLTLVAVVAVALGWSWLSRTDWAASVSILGIGEDYDNALEPIVKVFAAIVVMVAGTQMVQRGHRMIFRREPGHTMRRSSKSMRSSSA